MADSLKATFLTALTDVTLVQKDQLGDIRFNANKWYKYVKTNGGTDEAPHRAGWGVAYVGGAGYGNNEVTRNTDGASVRIYPAGLLAGGIGTANADSNVYYGWMQIKGPAVIDATRLNASIADGEYFQLSGNASNAYVDVTAYTDAPFGRAMDESAGEIYVDCPW